MNNKVKGFTLIELLAVIVILAIIALIITPIITGVIKKAKDSSDLRSAEGYVKAGEDYYAKASTSGGTLNTNVIDDLEVSSNKASDGSSLVVNSDGTTDMAITDINTEEDKSNCSVPLKSDYAVLTKTTMATEKIGTTTYTYAYYFGIDSVGGTKDYYFTSINKADSAPSTFAYSFDISDKSISDNTSIMAYLVTNGTNSYDVYLVSSKTIAAPADSSYLFAGMALAGDVNLSWLNTYFATNMSHMFDNTGKDKMTSLNLGTNFYTSNATDMSSMFSGTGFKAMISLDLGSNFYTMSVTDMSSMFDGTGYMAMTSLDLGNNFNAESATDMTYMFDHTGYTAMTSLDLGANFNAASATSMSNMFAYTGYTAMTTLDLGANFNAKSVTDMSSMFYNTGYTAMTILNLGDNFDTSSVTNMYDMFMYTGYNKLATLDLGDNFDTSSVTNMNDMFMHTAQNSTSFVSLDLGDKFDTSNVTNMSCLFDSCCQSLTSLDLGPAFTKVDDSYAFPPSYAFSSSGCQIKVSSKIYFDSTHFKINDTTTYPEQGNSSVPYWTLVSTY